MTTATDPTIYAGQIDLGNQNNSHTIAFRFIHERLPSAGGQILEIGCNTGYFGEALVQAGHHVTGVELSPSAGVEAQKRLSTVFIGSVESFLSADQFQEKRYDCITFGDVLEHISDPVTVLTAASSRLKDGGIVVVSVPNVTHIAIRAMVLGGRWIYSDRGIMDRTHVRFFDKRGVIELLENSKLTVEAIASVRVPASQTGVNFQQHFLEKLKSETADADAEIFQYISVARHLNETKTFQPSKRRILILWPLAEWSLGDIRLRAPLNSWAELYGGDVRWMSYDSCRDIDVSWADAIVIQRESSPVLLSKIRQWRAQGKAIIFDIDDLLVDIPSFLQSYAHYKSVRPFIQAALKSANRVTTTTERLAKELSVHSSCVSVTPNCSQHWRKVAAHYRDPACAVKLIIASSDTVRLDFVVPALKMILEDQALNVEIIAIGNTAEFLEKSGISVSKIPLLSYPEFLNYIANQNNSIGIIPLDDSLFSSCKSPIKYLDYSCCGVPSICSDVPPYSDIISHDLDGILVANEALDWYHAIRQLTLDPDKRTELSAAANGMAHERFSLKQSAALWEKVIESAISHAQLHPVAPESTLCLTARRLQRVSALIATPSIYPRAVKIIWREGLKGLARRLR